MFWKRKQNQEEFVWKDFRDKSYEELEQEVDEAYGRYVFVRNIKIAVVTIVLLVLFHDIIGFWVRFAPRFANHKTDEVIDVVASPVQTTLEDTEVVEYLTLEDNEKVKLLKRAEISMAGRVVAKNYLFWGNYLPGGKRIFQSTALFDLGIVWGRLTEPDVLKKYTFYSAKDVTARSMHSTLKLGVRRPPVPWPYARTHMAHLHIVPENADIMSALILLRKNQPVKLEGYLVDILADDNTYYRTLTSRTEYSTLHGRGAGEIMYVQRVQVGNRVYD